MSKRPHISVILACYNASRFLREAIDSVLTQTFDNFELIIVDDCSIDDSFAIAKSYQLRDSRIIVERLLSNSGPAIARNKAADMAAGDYLCIIDADDICKPNRFLKQVTYLNQHPESALVSSAVEYINEQGIVFGRTYPTTHQSKIKRKLLDSGNIIANPTVMMRRKAFFECKGYCEGLPTFEDYHLWMKFLRNGFQLNILPEVLISYRINRDAISNWMRSDRLLHLKDEILKQDYPSQHLLDQFSEEVAFCKTQLIPIEVRTENIEKTWHCWIHRISIRFHIEWLIERVTCGLQNIIS